MTIPKLKPGKTINAPIKGIPLIKKIDKNFFNVVGVGWSREEKNQFLQICLFIEKHCQQFLKYSRQTKKFLYHGSNYSKYSKYSLSNTRTNRTPKDTQVGVQKAVDEYLTLRGFKALRSNSLFCTSDQIITQDFGEDFIIFPIDGFNYTWSKHSDWAIDITDVTKPNALLIKVCKFLKIMSEKLETKLIKLNIYDGPYYDMRDAWTNLYEDCYYGNNDENVLNVIEKDITKIQKSFLLYDKFIKKYPKSNIFTSEQLRGVKLSLKKLFDRKSAAKQFCSEHKISNTNLEKTLKNGNEICINGYYISIKNDWNDNIYDLLKKYFWEN
jgi:hypothetical protein